MTIRAPLITTVPRTTQRDRGFVSSNLLLTVLAVAAVAVPFKQSNWPNPRPTPRASQPPDSSPNLLVTTLAPVAASPFSQKEWQIPSRRSVQQPDVQQNFLVRIPAVAASPFRHNIWHNQPVRFFYKDYSWIQNLHQTTLAPVLVPGLAKHRGFLRNVGRLLSG